MSSKVLINGWKSKSGEVFYGREGKAAAARADKEFEIGVAARELSTAVAPPWSDADVLEKNLSNPAHAQLVFKLAARLMDAGFLPDATVSAAQENEPQRADFEEIQASEERAKVQQSKASARAKQVRASKVSAKAKSKARKAA